jgi:hypothetical protein
MKKPEVLIVSPYFPPSTVAGVHRARHLAKHLPSFGWRPIVVCVDEAYHEQRLDPDLAALVPPTVEIEKVGALDARVTRPFGLGEISLRAWRPLRRAIRRLLSSRDIRAVLITGSPYYPMLLSETITREFKVPVVLDFQDPWVSHWGAGEPKLSKAGLAHWLATWLEPRALRSAAYVTAVSDLQKMEMAARYSWLDQSRMAAIPIGSDAEDFAALKSFVTVGKPNDIEPGTVRINYVGTVWPAVIPTLTLLLRAVARMRDSEPALYARLRLGFVGTTANPDDSTGFVVRPLAESLGVGAIVREVPQRVPYLEALSLMVHSDALLMIGSDEPHYTASKIYPVLMSGRPYLSLFHRASSAHAVLSSAGGGIALGFASREDLPALESSIADALARLATAPESVSKAVPGVCAAYEARAIAKQFAKIFDQIAVR